VYFFLLKNKKLNCLIIYVIKFVKFNLNYKINHLYFTRFFILEATIFFFF
jgi:hypothetical protein